MRSDCGKGSDEIKEPSATIADIVRQNINPVDRGDGQDGITLKVQLRLAVALLYNRRFAFQNRGQEVPVAARGLDEPESIRSVSCFTRSSMALTSRCPVNTSP